MRIRSILILLIILLALGGYFYLSRTPELAPKSTPRVFVWDVGIDEIQRIEIRLPREDKGETFIKIPAGDKFPWHFDDPRQSRVDVARWGGGIPLLLRGPGAERIIARDATGSKLAEFGLTQPQMELTLTLESGDILQIVVGDRTPGGNACYVQISGLNDIALVDYTWYQVLERLVKEPPYASPAAD